MMDRDLTSEEASVLVQHAIWKYENEEELMGRLKTVMDEKRIQGIIDTLIGTQKVRRIGPEILQNNESHTEVPELPDGLAPVLEGL